MPSEMNLLVCPSCGHVTLTRTSYTTCDACETFFYAAQSARAHPRKVSRHQIQADEGGEDHEPVEGEALVTPAMISEGMSMYAPGVRLVDWEAFAAWLSDRLRARVQPHPSGGDPCEGDVLHGWVVGIGHDDDDSETHMEIEFNTRPPPHQERWEKATLIRGEHACVHPRGVSREDLSRALAWYVAVEEVGHGDLVSGFAHFLGLQIEE